LADFGKSPLAIEAGRRIDEIFAIEREINGAAADQRLAIRQERIKPLVDELKAWMLTERLRLSRHTDLTKAMYYMLKRFSKMAGSVSATTPLSALLRRIALGRLVVVRWLRPRRRARAAAIYTLIATAKLNDVDPQAWLADVLRRIADHPAARLDELLPWHWKRHEIRTAAV
jgi:transposase